jgi:glycosyltransferase involved in cell wall biosynthesis
MNDPGPLLIVEDRVPHVDGGVGDPRGFLLAAALRRLRPATPLVWAAVSAEGADTYAPALERLGVEVHAGDVEGLLRARVGEFRGVIVARPHNHARVRPHLDRLQPRAVRIYDAESLFHRRSLREAAVRGDLAVEQRAGTEVGAEAAAILWADGVLTVAADAIGFAHAVHPDVPVAVCSYAVDAPTAVPGFDARVGLVNFGGFLAGPGGPNEDAAIIAAREIAPAVGESLVIAGAAPTPTVLALADDRTEVVGRVDDPVAFLSRFRVHLCPLRYGAGLKIRLVDAAAAGTPTVMTPCAAENLGLDAELTALLVAQDPMDQARLARTLLDDAGRWAAASEGVRALGAREFTRAAFDAALGGLLDAVGL